MSYHIINIGEPKVELTCKDNQIVCRGSGSEKKLPLEDVAAVVITSFSSKIHSELLLQAAERGVAFILCRNFKPVSIVLPANRSTDTHLTQAVLDLSDRTKKELWMKTVNAKCLNQLALAKAVNSDHPDIDEMTSVAMSKLQAKESVCARYYWRIAGKAIAGNTFIRDRHAAGMNGMLNFGYTILLAAVLRNLMAVGLDPTFGIHHMPRERAAPLAYDMMEPFRPVVDSRIYKWVTDMGQGEADVVGPDFKQWIGGISEEVLQYHGKQLSVFRVIELVIRSFRTAVKSGKVRLYKPWTIRNSKWDGYL